MFTEAVLSNDNQYTSFSYNGSVIRFRTSPYLECYTKVVEWDHGYIVVGARYTKIGEVEDYIDLIPILNNLYIDAEDFLKNIKEVRIHND